MLNRLVTQSLYDVFSPIWMPYSIVHATCHIVLSCMRGLAIQIFYHLYCKNCGSEIWGSRLLIIFNFQELTSLFLNLSTCSLYIHKPLRTELCLIVLDARLWPWSFLWNWMSLRKSCYMLEVMQEFMYVIYSSIWVTQEVNWRQQPKQSLNSVELPGVAIAKLPCWHYNYYKYGKHQ